MNKEKILVITLFTSFGVMLISGIVYTNQSFDRDVDSNGQPRIAPLFFMSGATALSCIAIAAIGAVTRKK